MLYKIIVLSLFLCSSAWATVPVERYPSGTPVQVCQPSDTNSNCGGSGTGTNYWPIVAGNTGIGTTLNVGIGTSNPSSYTLQVVGTIGVTGTVTASAGLTVVGNVGIGTVSTPANLTVYGNVGIGTLNATNISSTTYTALNNFGIHPASTIVVASSTSRNKASADYVCPGTNDSPCLQSAINVAQSINGTVQLLEGNFYIGTLLTITGEMAIVGLGKSITTLYLSNGVNTDVIDVTPSSMIGFFKLKDLTIMGNNAGNSAGRGLYTNANVEDITIEDVYFEQVAGIGVEIGYGWGLIFDNNLVESGSSNGMVIDNNSFSQAHITNNKFLNNNGWGLTIPANSGNCSIVGNTFDVGINNSDGGLSLNGTFHTVDGNVFRNLNSGTGGELDLLGNNNSIDGNSFSDYNNGTTTYSIKEETSSFGNSGLNTYFFIAGNLIISGGTNNFFPANSGAVGTGAWNFSNVGSLTSSGNVGIGTTFVGGAGEATLSVMNGNVGIGTYAPPYMLQVNGTFQGNPVFQAITQSSTIVIPVTNANGITFSVTGLSSATTVSTSGTPVNGEKIILAITDNGTAQGLSWTGISSTTVTLPTTTVISTELTIFMQYDSVKGWLCKGVA